MKKAANIGLFHSKLWNKYKYPLVPIFLWLVLTAGSTFLFPSDRSFSFSIHSLDSISREEILAPFSFNVEFKPEELEAKRQLAAESVEPVWVLNDTISEIQLEYLQKTINLIRNSGGVVRALSSTDVTWSNSEKLGFVDSIRINLTTRLMDSLSVRLSNDSWEYILQFYYNDDEGSLFLNRLKSILSDVLGRGILSNRIEDVKAVDGKIRFIHEGEEQSKPLSLVYDKYVALDEVIERLRNLSKQSMKESKNPAFNADSQIKLGYELLVPRLVPNLFYDAMETKNRKESAIAKIPVVKSIVLKGERIIDSNERITQQHIEKLQAMANKKKELLSEKNQFGMLIRWFGRFFLLGSIIFFFGYWLYRFRKEIFFDPRYMMFISAMMAIMVSIYGALILPLGLNHYLYPVAIGAIIITIVIDAPLAFIFTVALSLVNGALIGTGYFAILEIFIPSVFSVFAVERVRTRIQIMRSSLFIFTGYVLIILIQRFLSLQINIHLFSDVLNATINSLATPLIASGLLIAIEYIFGVTTELTLLELGDLNRPLLKRLSLEAPGTYHHSIMVGSLAEAAAEAIDASPLLVRAGAYYHDIGKMNRREYFVENQKGYGNIHDSLEPEESARFLSAHVTDGIKIAEQYHLPKAIKDFILEHHGTSLMVFFYDKALKERPEDSVEESMFRYPGPKPQSKETGILMLADAAEASSRSLDDPDEDTLRESVRKVVINKYNDLELDECPLTLHELHLTVEAFLPVLGGIHHHRIKYPSREKMQERLESKKNK